MLAVKRLRFSPYTDVHFSYHLVYDLEDMTADPQYARKVSDGQVDGPSIAGIPEEELETIIASVPSSRRGIRDWIQEGGLSIVPASTPIFSRNVPREKWIGRDRSVNVPLYDNGTRQTYYVIIDMYNVFEDDKYYNI